MIRRLMLDIPINRSSVFAWERDLRGGYVVTRNGGPVIHCDTEQEAKDEADDYAGEVMRQAMRPLDVAPITLTGDALRRQAAQDVADLFG